MAAAAHILDVSQTPGDFRVMTPADLHTRIAAVTDRIAGRPLDAELGAFLNAEFGPATEAWRGLKAACEAGVAEGWLCQREGGGLRWGRIFKPGPELGGFSVDAVESLALDGRTLAEKRVRFVKVDAALLLQTHGGASADIHPADLSDLMARFGIDLIAMKIERENEVVDLIDYDVRFAQGNLFSPPRPVKADIAGAPTALEAAQ